MVEVEHIRATVAAGANCVVQVVLTPTAQGARSGTLSINTNAGGITVSTTSGSTYVQYGLVTDVTTTADSISATVGQGVLSRADGVKNAAKAVSNLLKIGFKPTVAMLTSTGTTLTASDWSTGAASTVYYVSITSPSGTGYTGCKLAGAATGTPHVPTWSELFTGGTTPVTVSEASSYARVQHNLARLAELLLLWRHGAPDHREVVYLAHHIAAERQLWVGHEDGGVR